MGFGEQIVTFATRLPETRGRLDPVINSFLVRVDDRWDRQPQPFSVNIASEVPEEMRSGCPLSRFPLTARGKSRLRPAYGQSPMDIAGYD